MNEAILHAGGMSPKEFPLRSLRQFLIPEATLLVKSFEAASISELDEKINTWISSTKAIVAVPAPVAKFEHDGNKTYILSVTYLPANE